VKKRGKLTLSIGRMKSIHWCWSFFQEGKRWGSNSFTRKKGVSEKIRKEKEDFGGGGIINRQTI